MLNRTGYIFVVQGHSVQLHASEVFSTKTYAEIARKKVIERDIVKVVSDVITIQYSGEEAIE